MSYFEVNPAGIDRFADQMRRYHESASAVLNYIEEHERKGTAEQLGGQGLLNYFWLTHDDFVNRARSRTNRTQSVGFLAEYGFRNAADYYRRCDLAAADRLDSTYPAVRPAPFEWVGDTPAEAWKFEDRLDPREHLRPPDGGELQPQAAALAKGVGALSDATSMSWWVRQILLEITGRDPIKDVVEFFAGDWEAVGRCADGWMRCSSTLSSMGSIMSHADEALHSIWKGNAADAAVDFVQRLSTATMLESRFFLHLYWVYKSHVEVAYFGYEMVNYLVGQLLDLLAEAVVAFLTSGTVAGPVLVGIVAVVDAIIFVIDTLRQVYHGYRIGTAVIGKPGEDDEPECAMESLYRLDPDNVPASYQHPALR